MDLIKSLTHIEDKEITEILAVNNVPGVAIGVTDGSRKYFATYGCRWKNAPSRNIHRFALQA